MKKFLKQDTLSKKEVSIKVLELNAFNKNNLVAKYS